MSLTMPPTVNVETLQIKDLENVVRISNTVIYVSPIPYLPSSEYLLEVCVLETLTYFSR